MLITLAMYWAVYGHSTGPSDYTGLAVLQGVGCYHVAKHRSRTKWWALLGWLPIVCLALPWLLPPKARDDVRAPRLPVRIAGAVGVIVVSLGVIAWSRPQPAPSEAAPASTVAWAPRDALGVRLATPFPLKADKRVFDALPEEVRAMYESVESSAGNSASGDFLVRLVRSTLRKDYVPTLDGYLEDVLKEMATKVGDREPHVSVTSTRVSGLDARRAECVATVGGRTSHFDAVCTFEGQTRWEVIVAYTGDAARSDSQRVLSSVEIPDAGTRR